MKHTRNGKDDRTCCTAIETIEFIGGPYDGHKELCRTMLPSENVQLARSGVVAIVSAQGGEFSHTAIVARSLGIPAITGIFDVTSQIQAGMPLLVDGVAGSVVAAPSQADEESFERRKREFESLETSIAANEKLPCVTQDGAEIALLANIGLPEEVAGVAEHNLAALAYFVPSFSWPCH